LEALGSLGVVLVLLCIAVLVMWFFLPFAVFGVKDLLREQNRRLGEIEALLRRPPTK